MVAVSQSCLGQVWYVVVCGVCGMWYVVCVCGMKARHEASRVAVSQSCLGRV